MCDSCLYTHFTEHLAYCKTLMVNRNSFVVIQWIVFFLIASSSAFSQKTRIEGKVVDRETGKAVPFASVGIVGTSLGTSTNLNGEFSLVVD